MHGLQLANVKANMGPPLTLQALVETLHMVLDVTQYKRAFTSQKSKNTIILIFKLSIKYLNDRPRTPVSPASTSFNS